MSVLPKYKKLIFIILGSISFLLGALGLFLPVLPTTPFWLLTAYLYLKSSRKLYDRAMAIPLFGKIVTDFQIHKAISKRTKIISVSTIWITVALSIYIVKILWVSFLLIAISVGVSWHILSYKTLSKNEEKN